MPNRRELSLTRKTVMSGRTCACHGRLRTDPSRTYPALAPWLRAKPLPGSASRSGRAGPPAGPRARPRHDAIPLGTASESKSPASRLPGRAIAAPQLGERLRRIRPCRRVRPALQGRGPATALRRIRSRLAAQPGRGFRLRTRVRRRGGRPRGCRSPPAPPGLARPVSARGRRPGPGARTARAAPHWASGARPRPATARGRGFQRHRHPFPGTRGTCAARGQAARSSSSA